MRRGNRVFIIGIDGGTWDVLTPRLERGLMPRFKALLDGGSWGTLLSTIPPFTIPAWASFFTGTNPGKHGVRGFFQVGPEDYEDRGANALVTSRSISGTPLWEHFSRNNLQAGFINVPLTYPASEIKGFMISGMMTPPGSKNFTYPRTLADYLDDYVIDIGHFDESRLSSKLRQRNRAQLMDEILHMQERRTANVVRLLKIFPDLNFFMVVFTGFDRVCHAFWDCLSGSDKSPAESRSVQDKLIREKIDLYFAELDSSLGKILDFRDKDTLCFVVSDHGFAQAPTKEVYLNNWLQENGLLQLRSGMKNIADVRYWLAKTGFNKERAKKWLAGLPLGKWNHKLERRVKGRPSLIEWGKTRAFATPLYTFTCGVTINRKGQKPYGIVDGPAEYKKLCEFIVRELPNMTDPETRERIVDRVFRREEIFPGPHTESFPDLVVIFKKDYSVTQQISNSVLKKRTVSRRSGDHVREGIFVASGKPFGRGRLDREVNIVDVLPTCLYLFGLSLPGDLDGRILKEIFTSEYLETRRPKSGPLP